MRTVAFGRFTLVFLLFSSFVHAATEIVHESDGVSVTRTYHHGSSELTVLSSTDLLSVLEEYARSEKDGDKVELQQSLTRQALLPCPRGFRYEIRNVETRVGARVSDPQSIAWLDAHASNGTEAVVLGEPMIFRDLVLADVAITPFTRVDGEWCLLDRIDIAAERVPDLSTQPLEGGPAASFMEVYRSIMTDDELDEIGTPTTKGGYLLVSHSSYIEALSDWIDWKEKTGSHVEVVQTPNHPSYATVRGLIQAAWGELDVKPEYILLVGDPVFGNNATMPGNFIESEYSGEVITDYSYSLLSGLDYWPEAWIGRFSVTSYAEAVRVANKTVSYERGDNLAIDSDWVTRGLVVCDNTYSSTGLTSSWIRREMLSGSFTEVDSVWYPPTQVPGPIISAINLGVSWVNYRGFGNPAGWTFPIFRTTDVNSLVNGFQLPVVTSIVCGGGDFVDGTDPCLGEAFLRAGSVNEPTGAVAFVGPSEHNTHTRWNNAISMNLYAGLLHENFTTFGSLVFRGKMGVYSGFPNNRFLGTEEESVYFYFFTYNILGDPGLTVRNATPVELHMAVADTLLLGSNDLPVLITDDNDTPVEGINVTVVTEDWGPISLLSDATGQVRFDFTTFEPPAGNLFITATGFNTIAAVDTLTVSATPVTVALSDLVMLPAATAGATVEITPTLWNRSEETLSNLSGVLVALEEGVTVTVAEQEYEGSVAPNAHFGELSYEIEIDEDVPNGFDPGLILELYEDDDLVSTVRISMSVDAPLMAVVNSAVVADGPGDSETFALTFRNHGDAAIDASTVTISTEHPWITLVNASSSLQAIDADNQAPTEQMFSLTVAENAYQGWTLPMTWTLEAESGRTESGALVLVLGDADTTDPYGPDSYGYVAFDDCDENYFHRPRFDWYEIDPEYGGSGTALDFSDNWYEQDESAMLALPFSFTFYGQEFDTITVCTNGWLKFGDTGEVQFRNWNLLGGPSPNNLVAPFWDDLIMAGGRVVFKYQEELDRYIVQWSRMKLPTQYHTEITQTFQAILYDPAEHPTTTGDGIIDFQYLEVNDGDTGENYSTVGIRNCDGTAATELRYANISPDAVSAIGAERAYRITTDTEPAGSGTRIASINMIDDGSMGSGGDGDGFPDNNETIALRLSAINLGTLQNQDVTVSVSTEDPYIDIAQGSATFSNLDPFETVQADQPLLVSISQVVPDQEQVVLLLTLTDEDNNTYLEWLTLEIRSARLEISNTVVYDLAPGGNGNGWAEPGETIELGMMLTNAGRNDIGAATIVLEADLDNYVTIVQDELTLESLEAGQTVTLPDRFEIEVSPDCPEFAVLRLPIRFSQNGEEFPVDSMALSIGEYCFYEDFEGELNNQWGMVQGEWHVSTLEAFSPSHSIRWGAEDGSDYSANRRDRLITNPFTTTGSLVTSFNAKWSLGTGDTVRIDLVQIGADTFHLVTCTGVMDEWQSYDMETWLSNSERNISLLMTATSNPYGTGTGFYADDIRIREDEVGVSEQESAGIPETYDLVGPYPNPFNPQTVVRVDLPQASSVQVDVFDVLGRQVATLLDTHLAAGRHEVIWTADNFASGLYFIRMRTANVRIIRKAVVLK